MEGILTKQQEKKLAKIVDEAIELNGLLELVDGYAARVLISLIDDKALDKLPEGLKLNLSLLVDAAIDEDVERAEKIAANIINDFVDIPGLNENEELMIFEGAIKIIVGAILTKIRK